MYVLSREYYPDPTCALAVARAAVSSPRVPLKVERPLVYICSPFAGDEERNKRLARAYCRFAVRSGYLPLAPHLLFPQFMDDRVPEERAMALLSDLGSGYRGPCA